MSNPWFRHYCGMMRDEKLVGAAVRSRQPVERVVWVWGAILESASEIDDGGKYFFDAAEAAYFLRADEADILAILDALASAGRLAEGFVVKWGDRQFQSDKSASRQAAYRERKRGQESHGDDHSKHGDGLSKKSDVTPPSRDGQVTPQDTDTDTENKSTHASAISLPEVDDWGKLEFKLREAAGWQREVNPNLAVVGPIVGLIQGGCDLDLDVLPTIKARAHACRGHKSWKYFIKAIQQARDDRLAAMKPPDPLSPYRISHAARSKPNSIADGFAAVDAVIDEIERREQAASQGSRRDDFAAVP